MSIEREYDNELFFGLVCPVGTNTEVVIDQLKKAFSYVHYKNELIRLSDLLDEIEGLTPSLDPSLPEDERISNHMKAGNELRRKLSDSGALAKLSMIEIALRRDKHKHEDEPVPRMAYILDSLKHPGEVEILKEIADKMRESNQLLGM